MRKILFLFILLPGLLTAQEKKIQNVSTGLVFSPALNLLNDQSESSTSSGFGYKSVFSWTSGFDFVMSFTDKFKISAGIFAGVRNFERTDYCYVCDVAYTPVSEFKMKYLSLPVNAWYYFVEKRLDVYGIAGFTNSFYFSLKEYRTTYSGTIDEFSAKEEFKRYQFGLNAGLGFNYNLTYRLSLGLNSIYTFYPGYFGIAPKLKLSNTGFQSALYYKF